MAELQQRIAAAAAALESIPKRSLENGNGISLDCGVRYKRRKVSAVRHFPPRCGRNAVGIGGTLTAAKSVTTEPLEISIDSGSHNAAEISGKPTTENLAVGVPLEFSVDSGSPKAADVDGEPSAENSAIGVPLAISVHSGSCNAMVSGEKPTAENLAVGAQLGISVNSVLPESSRNLDKLDTKSAVVLKTQKPQSLVSSETILLEPLNKSETVSAALSTSVNEEKPIDSLMDSKPVEAELAGSLEPEKSEFFAAEEFDTLKSLDQPVSANDSEMVEIPSSLEQPELPNVDSLKDTVGQIDVSVPVIETKEENLPSLYQPELPNVSESANQSQQVEAMSGLELLESANQSKQVEAMSGLEQIASISSEKDTGQLPIASVPVVEPVKENAPRRFPRRRVSCHRDWPPGCGRNAQTLSKNKSQKAVTLGNKNSTGESPSIEPSIEIYATASVENVTVKSVGNGTNETGEEIHVESVVKNNVIGVETEEATKNVEVRAVSKKMNVEKMKGVSKKVQISANRGDKSPEKERMCQSPSRKMKKDVGGSVGEVQKESGKHIMVKKSDKEFVREPVAKNAAVNQPHGEMAVKISANRQGKSPELERMHQSPNKKMKQIVGSSVKEVQKESGKHIMVKKSEKEFVEELDEKNTAAHQSHGEMEVDSGYSSDKAIVQAGGKKIKKERAVARKSILTKKKDDDGLSIVIKKNDGLSFNMASPEGKPTKRELQVGKSASNRKNKLVVRGGEDSLQQEDDKKVSAGEHLNLDAITDFLDSVKSDDSEKTARQKVKESLRMFQMIYRKLLREEESNHPVQNIGRIDLFVSNFLKKKNKWVNTGKSIVGVVPGVEVGDEFHYRVELALVGLHRPFQSGIDYLTQGKTCLATSVVASGGYADDMDNSDVLVYSGQGGQPVGANKQAEDQKLERGNLALKNSIDAKTPVRVIRGFKEQRASDTSDARGKISSTYTYDGLYSVEKYWQEKGQYGCLIFKFELKRMPGQPEVAVKEVKKSKKLAPREGICIRDISQGKEKIPICAVNTLDEERPLPFKYMAKMKYPSWYSPSPPTGCNCTNGCLDSIKCVCVVRNGGEIPYNYNGAIVEAKPLVYECGPSCSCPPSCHNRVSQHGSKLKLEIFKTESRGWGVRCLTSIPSGSFICEYTGQLLQDKEAEQRISNDEYLFDIGHNYNEQSLWDGLSTLIPPDLHSSDLDKDADNEQYTIDAAECGNVGRFINHSCSPNLYAQNVLYDHDDKRVPHIMFFAAENIPPLQELTYHYNYKIGQVHDSNGNIKQKNCYCGSSDCTGRLY